MQQAGIRRSSREDDVPRRWRRHAPGMRRMSTWITVAAAAAGMLTAGGCGTDQPAACAHLDAVQASIDHVRNANVSENGMSQLRTDLSQLQANLIQLRTDVQATHPAEVAAVRGAANQLAATIAAARVTPNETTLGTVRTAMSGLQDSVRQLADAMSGTC
jgi:hypothetical protein